MRRMGCIVRAANGGVTWKRLTDKGLPTAPLGKVAVAIARSNPSRVYALIETGDGEPWAGWKDHKGQSGQRWRSDDAGESWQVVSHDRQLRGRTHYYTRHAVAPDNENEVYFFTAAYAKTLDGGKTILDVKDPDLLRQKGVGSVVVHGEHRASRAPARAGGLGEGEH